MDLYYSDATSTCDLKVSSTNLFFCQCVTSIILAPIIYTLLQPFGIPLMVSQHLTSILLSPSFLGKIVRYTDYVFPVFSFPTLTFYSNLGMILQIFIIGIQTDPSIILNTERKIIVIGFCVTLLPLALSYLSANLIHKNVEGYSRESLFLTGTTFSVGSFPVIANYLHEVKIINSDFSRVAFACAMLNGFLSYIVRICSQIANITLQDYQTREALISEAFFGSLVTMLVTVYFIRPLIKKMTEGQELSKGQLYTWITMALLSYLIYELCRIQPYFGVWLFGLVVPSQSPLGLAIVEALDFFIIWMFRPVYFMKHGLKVDMFAVTLKSALCFEGMALSSWIGKFLGAFLPALHYNMSLKEATLLGLILNIRGFLEIGYWDALETDKILDTASYTVQCLSILVIMASLAPIVRHLYNSIMEWKLCYVGNIQYLEQSSELSVLACMFNEENVPSIIHLLKATTSPTDCPIIASIVHLIDIVGHSAPFVVSHKSNEKMPTPNLVTQRILNVFRQFYKKEKRVITINPYTVASPYSSIHNDVFIISIKERTSLIILPFHELYSSGANVDIKTVNTNVLRNSPCSVGILVDRGCLGGLKYVFESWTSYRVLILFVGGPDDREALALGARMLGNPTIDLTVIRFCKLGQRVKRTLDDEMVDEFLRRTTGNDRLAYMRKELNTCADVLRAIEAIAEQYELVILGRHQDEDSLLVDYDYAYCNTYPELGIIGNIFKKSGYCGNASILVLQQQLNIV